MMKARIVTVLALGTGVLSGRPGLSDEVRAIWVTRWDYSSERDVRNIVENCASLGLNRVYFQVRGRADAFYRSRLEPWGEELGATDPGFDPLQVAIAEAHKRRIELHAWVNTLVGWKGKAPPRSRRHIFHRHPDWFLLDRYGKRHLLDDNYTIVNCCLPVVRKHIVDVIGDIVRRYPVNGIHLDYIRFTAREAKARQAVPYDSLTLHKFRKLTTGFPTRYPKRWNEFRRQAVSDLVHEISTEMKRLKPRCKLSAAVIRDLKVGRDVYFQDADHWQAKGWIDEVVPMNYERGAEDFYRHARNARDVVGHERVVCGVGVYLFKTPGDLTRQVELSRRVGVRGYALFGYANFFESPSHAAQDGWAAQKLRSSLRAELRRLNRQLVGTRASAAPKTGAETRARVTPTQKNYFTARGPPANSRTLDP